MLDSTRPRHGLIGAMMEPACQHSRVNAEPAGSIDAAPPEHSANLATPARSSALIALGMAVTNLVSGGKPLGTIPQLTRGRAAPNDGDQDRVCLGELQELI